MVSEIKNSDLFDKVCGKYTVTYKGELCGIAETGGEIAVIRGDSVVKYRKFANCISKSVYDFAGFSAEQLLKSGRDIVAEKLISDGFEFEDVKGILPGSYDNSYIAIGSHTTKNSYTVDCWGNIYRQPEYDVKNPGVLGFSPKSISPLGDVKPEMSFLNGVIPILLCRYKKDNKTLETMYLVSQGNYFVEFPVWIRAAEYENDELVSVKFYNADMGNTENILEIDGNLFYDYLFAVIDYSNDFIKEQSYINIPEKELERIFYCSMLTAEGQTDGFRLKYGNLIYNLETHDNFPPNYITAIATYAMCGHLKKARLMTEHFLSNAVDARGMLVYRQGKSQTYGYSGSEIGQLLWVLGRIKDITTPKGWLDEYTDVLEKIGDNLVRTISQVDGHEDISLVHMCAEADTNGRIYDYIQNSLWAVRGLEALDKIIGSEKYKAVINNLKESIEKGAERFKITTGFGELIPFQLQYTPLPLNLSNCDDTAFDVTDEYLKKYFNREADPHDDFESGEKQDFWENAYANYRYYPEILSAMLIDEKYAEGIDNLRRTLGGEILGMTRFTDRLDDWPAYNNAIYLLETGQVERYRLLMYSHMLYHGLPDFGVYYEQAGFNENNMTVVADTSLPSNMLPAFMLTQMFCYTSVDGKSVEILKAVPKEWFEKGFEVKGIYTPYGAVSVKVRDKKVSVELSGDFSETDVILYLPSKVLEIKENCYVQI